ncbi:Uma2 family endonuclease [Endozoicomonas sp. 4G]|uniref:Uma2 family endonuclease n=1 Tax=Endozoicomonas sp. 4G TaxID=2872754 RepID=UPI0020791089|nr:Uma2 family endonuclease [Endozoicomonas sp. 4G]
MSNLAEDFFLMSESEYLAFEESSKERHEYYDGYVVAMTGGSANHDVISLNAAFVLREKAPDGCQVFGSNLRLKLDHLNRSSYCYPDAWMRCCEPRLNKETVGDKPCLIVEVLSPGTRKTDQTYKAVEYSKALKHCRGEYLLVDSQVPSVILLGWVGEEFKKKSIAGLEDHIRIDRLDATIPVEDFYRGVFSLT